MLRRPDVGSVTRAAVALLCACALWLVVNAEETAAAWVPVRVSLAVDSAVRVEEPLPVVRAYVVGRRRDLLRLTQAPPSLHRAVTDDARDSVRFEVREQDLDLPAGAVARVSDVRPRLLTVRLRPR